MTLFGTGIFTTPNGIFTNLTVTNFTGTSLYGTNLTVTNLTGSNATMTNLVNISSITGQYQINGLISDALEQTDLVPIPMIPVGTQIATTAPVNYEGAIHRIDMPVRYNHIITNVNTWSVSGLGNVLIYQRSGGLASTTASPASLVSSSSFTPSVAGSYVLTPTGTNQLSPGVAYILYGKQAGTWTYSTYTANAYNSINAVLKTGAPATFTTTIASTSSAPTTFDPTSQTTATVNPLICRLSS